jgi:hypothetical protein
MKKPKTAAAEKSAPKAKAEQPVAIVIKEATPKKSTAQPTNKPKAAIPKPASSAKAGQPVVSVTARAQPNKASPAQKAPDKAKVVKPKAKATKMANPALVNPPSDGIWPNWVENLLVSFGIKKK